MLWRQAARPALAGCVRSAASSRPGAGRGVLRARVNGDAFPVAVVRQRPQDAAPLQPWRDRARRRPARTDDDLRHRPPTGPLGKQAAKVRDAVDRALLEREVESLQKPARPSRGSENIEQED